MTSLVDHSFHRLLIRYLRWARSAAPFRLNAHLKVAPAQCVYGFYFLSDFGQVRSVAPVATLSPSSDHHITPQIYISYEICGARRCSIP